jgi:AraC-like DNA-binding protein
VVGLRGAFERRAYGGTQTCGGDTVFSEPAAEPHSNKFGPSGATVLIVEPLAAAGETLGSAARPFLSPVHADGLGIGLIARRLTSELAASDRFTELAIDTLVIQMLIATARRPWQPERSGSPRWLRTVLDILHNDTGRAFSLRDLAATVDLHPTYLARAFQARTGQSPARYGRNLRLSEAAAALRCTNSSIAQIALDCGFADQSHFTRAFTRTNGIPPGRYREQLRNRPELVERQPFLPTSATNER